MHIVEAKGTHHLYVDFKKCLGGTSIGATVAPAVA